MDEHAQCPPAPQAAQSVATPTPPTRPGKHGGKLWSGNPKAKGGRTPAWIREQLRAGLAQALPAIKHALKTGEDLRTGSRLSWADFAKTVEVASRISMPAQSQLGSMGDVPFTIRVGAAAAEEEPVPEPEPSLPLSLALIPRVASAESRAAPTVRAGAAPGTRSGPFGPGVTRQ